MDVAYELALTRSPAGDTTVERTIRIDGVLAMAMTVRAVATGRTDLDIHYGPSFSGLRDLRLHTEDGATFAGTLDGREVVPFAAGAPRESVRFVDGDPPPATDVDPRIPSAITAILRRAERETAGQGDPSGYGQAAQGYTDPAAEIGGHFSPTRTSPECRRCKAGAIAAGITCAVTVAISCGGSLFFYGVCVGIGVGLCTVAEIAALDLCDHTVCCPVSCGGSPSTCCFGGETCLRPPDGLCCSPGTVPCGGRACCPAGDTCTRDGSCCPRGHAVCGDACCELGESCAAGRCCLHPCGGACCAFNERCIDADHGRCCAFPNAECNGQCCGAGEVCLGGTTCCAAGQACGSRCCGSGQRCVDPARGLCDGCPSGQVGVPDPVTGGTVCCPPTTSSGACNGACCALGQMCCAAGGAATASCRSDCIR